MKEIVFEYKLINHNTKQVTKYVYCVEFPWKMNVGRDEIEQVKNQVKDNLNKYIEGYTLKCEHVKMGEMKALVDGSMIQVKFCKKLCFDFSMGEKPCEEGGIFKYEWIKGGKMHAKYSEGMVKEMAPGESFGMPSMPMTSMPSTTFMPPTPEMPVPEQFGGGDIKKYHKYKFKYLNLKNQIKNKN